MRKNPGFSEPSTFYPRPRLSTLDPSTLDHYLDSATDTDKVLTNTDFGVILHLSGVNYVQRVHGHLLGVNLHYESKLTLSKVFLHYFGVNMIAALWTLTWC